MKNSNKEKLSTHLKLVKWISSAVCMSALLLTSSVSADQRISHATTSAPEQKPLMDWSKKLTTSLNAKMERKLEDILNQAEYARLHDSYTQNLLASMETDGKQN